MVQVHSVVPIYRQICKWLKQAVCKTATVGFVGSNPTLPTNFPEVQGVRVDFVIHPIRRTLYAS